MGRMWGQEFGWPAQGNSFFFFLSFCFVVSCAPFLWLDTLVNRRVLCGYFQTRWGDSRPDYCKIWSRYCSSPLSYLEAIYEFFFNIFLKEIWKHYYIDWLARINIEIINLKKYSWQYNWLTLWCFGTIHIHMDPLNHTEFIEFHLSECTEMLYQVSNYFFNISH